MENSEIMPLSMCIYCAVCAMCMTCLQRHPLFHMVVLLATTLQTSLSIASYGPKILLLWFKFVSNFEFCQGPCATIGKMTCRHECKAIPVIAWGILGSILASVMTGEGCGIYDMNMGIIYDMGTWKTKRKFQRISTTLRNGRCLK